MTQHPTLETISGYVLSPKDQEYRDLRRHLLSCEQCRQRTDRLSTLTRKLQHDVPHYRNIDNADTEEAINQSFAGQHLTVEQRQKLKQSPSAMKAVLHSLSHSAAMQRALQTDTSTQITTQAPTSQSGPAFIKELAQWWRQLFNWHSPAWITIPVTAIVVFALTITLTPHFSQQSAQSIVTAYQDAPVVTFQAAGVQHPGIGFFSNTPSTSQPFAPVQVTLDTNNSLILNWPAIKGAVAYTVAIAEIENGTSKKLFQQTSYKPQIQFMPFTHHSGHRYTWTISGNTKDGQHFQAQGGFVVQ